MISRARATRTIRRCTFDQAGLGGVIESAENVPRLLWFLTDIVRGEELMMPTDPIRIKPGEAGTLIVQLPYFPDHVAKIKSVAGRRWHAKEQHWTVPHDDGRGANC